MMEADPVCSCSFRCSINSVLQQNHHRFIHKIPRSDSLLYKDFSFSTSFSSSSSSSLYSYSSSVSFICHFLYHSCVLMLTLSDLIFWIQPDIFGVFRKCLHRDRNGKKILLCGGLRDAHPRTMHFNDTPLPRGVRQGFGRLIQKEARTPTASKFTCKLYNSYSSGQGRVHSGFKGLCGRVSAEHLQATRWEQRVERRACKCRQSERGRSTNELPGVSLTDVNNTPI